MFFFLVQQIHVAMDLPSSISTDKCWLFPCTMEYGDKKKKKKRGHLVAPCSCSYRYIESYKECIFKTAQELLATYIVHETAEGVTVACRDQCSHVLELWQTGHNNFLPVTYYIFKSIIQAHLLSRGRHLCSGGCYKTADSICRASRLQVVL